VRARAGVRFLVPGRSLKPSLVESAIKLSHGKYCSASAMLGKTALIAHGHELIQEIPGSPAA
jgi:putative redox protein